MINILVNVVHNEVVSDLVVAVLAGNLQRIEPFVLLRVHQEQLRVVVEHVQDFQPVVSSSVV